jgi:DNA-binding transcriptional LysR family regulator
VAFDPTLVRRVPAPPGLTLLLRETQREEGLRLVRTGEVDVALVADWSGRLTIADHGSGVLRFYRLIRDPLVLVLPRGHPAADSSLEVDLDKLRDEPWLAAPPGEPSRQAVDKLLAGMGGMPPAPWEFEGLSTILSMVAHGIGIAALPRLTLAAGDRRVAVRELPGASPARDVYAVARASSVRRPSVAVMLAALDAAAGRLGRLASGVAFNRTGHAPRAAAPAAELAAPHGHHLDSAAAQVGVRGGVPLVGDDQAGGDR